MKYSLMVMIRSRLRADLSASLMKRTEVVIIQILPGHPEVIGSRCLDKIGHRLLVGSKIMSQGPFR